MAKTSARSVAWDPSEQRVLVVVQRGKDRFLTSLTADGALETQRKVPKGFEHFRVEIHEGVPFAVFKKHEAVGFLPLDKGRAKSVALDHGPVHRVAWRGCEPRWVVGGSVVEVTPTGSRILDGSEARGEVWVAGRNGLQRRPVGGMQWEVVAPVNRTAKAVAATDRLVVLGCYDGTRVHVVGDSVNTHKGRPVWWLVEHQGAIYGNLDYEICRVEPDGTQIPTGMSDPEHATYMDQCLFSTPAGLFYVIGESMHRFDGDNWHDIDVESAFVDG